MSAVREIGAFEAKNTLGTLLDIVQQGEEVLITRHGKPVARLAPVTGERDRAAAARIRARAKASADAPISGKEWKIYRDQGRP
ncbi:MAG: type II toxin-antitoxin system Phd/YefM family antitoxin [Methylocystis sp.]|jgi:prevent-host-death family protein